MFWTSKAVGERDGEREDGSSGRERREGEGGKIELKGRDKRERESREKRWK